MDFLKKLATESTGSTTATTESKGSSDNPQAPAAPSQSELLSNAQVLADAARSTLQKEPNKVDNAKVAGAAADLLDSAESYGKLDSTTGIGSYVEKAQNYLHQYETSHSTTAAAPPATATTTTTTTTAAPEGGEPAAKAPPAAESHDEAPAAEKSEGGGYGDMMKIAGDFLKK